ncbi:hypothetical protein VPH35_078013 [Triticum aestivum]
MKGQLANWQMRGGDQIPRATSIPLGPGYISFSPNLLLHLRPPPRPGRRGRCAIHLHHPLHSITSYHHIHHQRLQPSSHHGRHQRRISTTSAAHRLLLSFLKAPVASSFSNLLLLPPLPQAPLLHLSCCAPASSSPSPCCYSFLSRPSPCCCSSSCAHLLLLCFLH